MFLLPGQTDAPGENNPNFRFGLNIPGTEITNINLDMPPMPEYIPPESINEGIARLVRA